MSPFTRRTFFQTAATLGAAALFPAPYQKLAAAIRKKVKITDVKCMIVRGTWDWNLVKIETDSGVYGIGEAYWGPGVKDLILTQMKPLLLGEDPLNVDKLYTKCLMRSAGAGAIGGVTVTAASGIEIALWDLVGRLLDTPVCNLLGGRFRDRVRFYRTMQVVQRVDDPNSWREHVRQARSEKFGWTAFKFQGDGVPPKADPEFREPGHDPYARNLTARDIRRIVKGMDIVREELGPDIDFAIECHWRLIYTIDPRGLPTLGLTAQDNVQGHTGPGLADRMMQRRADYFESQDGLNYLAQETGGLFVHDTNDIGGGIRAVLDDQKGYYLIGYTPDDGTFQQLKGKERQYRKISVKVKKPGLSVRSRPGFFGVPDQEIKPVYRTRGEQLFAALASPWCGIPPPGRPDRPASSLRRRISGKAGWRYRKQVFSGKPQ